MLFYELMILLCLYCVCLFVRACAVHICMCAHERACVRLFFHGRITLVCIRFFMFLCHSKIEKDLKGVMRVGQLAKGLLLHDSLDFELVVLCSYRPTQSLLKDIMDNIPVQLKVCFNCDNDKFAAKMDMTFKHSEKANFH